MTSPADNSKRVVFDVIKVNMFGVRQPRIVVIDKKAKQVQICTTEGAIKRTLEMKYLSGIEEWPPGNGRSSDDIERSVVFKFIDGGGSSSSEAKRDLLFASKKARDSFVDELETLEPRLVERRRDGTIKSSEMGDKMLRIENARRFAKEALLGASPSSTPTSKPSRLSFFFGTGKATPSASSSSSSSSAAATVASEGGKDASSNSSSSPSSPPSTAAEVSQFLVHEENLWGQSDLRVACFSENGRLLELIDVSNNAKAAMAENSNTEFTLRRIDRVHLHSLQTNALALSLSDGAIVNARIDRRLVMTFATAEDRGVFVTELQRKLKGLSPPSTASFETNWIEALPIAPHARFEAAKTRKGRVAVVILVSVRSRKLFVIKTRDIPGYQPGTAIPSKVPLDELITIVPGRLQLERHPRNSRLLHISQASDLSILPSSRETIEFEFSDPGERERFCNVCSAVAAPDVIASADTSSGSSPPVKKKSFLDGSSEIIRPPPTCPFLRVPTYTDTSSLWFSDWARDRVRIFATSFNVGASPPPDDLSSLSTWLPSPQQLEGGGPSSPDLLVFGFQELGAASNREAWVNALRAYLNGVSVASLAEGFGGLDFVLLESTYMWEMGIYAFCRPEHARDITSVSKADLPTGMAVAKAITGVQLGNKGAVAVALRWRETTLAFVNCHFAARADAVRMRKRESDFRSIVGKMKLDTALSGTGLDWIHQHKHVILMGDLNYRVDLPFEEVVRLHKSGSYGAILAADQLERVRAAGKVFAGFKEAPITFPPTYRWERNSTAEFSNKRNQAPSYTDRIIFHSLPGEAQTLTCDTYAAAMHMMGSDHRPVTAMFTLALRRFYASPIPPTIYLNHATPTLYTALDAAHMPVPTLLLANLKVVASSPITAPAGVVLTLHAPWMSEGAPASSSDATLASSAATVASKFVDWMSLSMKSLNKASSSSSASTNSNSASSSSSSSSSAASSGSSATTGGAGESSSAPLAAGTVGSGTILLPSMGATGLSRSQREQLRSLRQVIVDELKALVEREKTDLLKEKAERKNASKGGASSGDSANASNTSSVSSSDSTLLSSSSSSSAATSAASSAATTATPTTNIATIDEDDEDEDDTMHHDFSSTGSSLRSVASTASLLNSSIASSSGSGRGDGASGREALLALPVEYNWLAVETSIPPIRPACWDPRILKTEHIHVVVRAVPGADGSLLAIGDIGADATESSSGGAKSPSSESASSPSNAANASSSSSSAPATPTSKSTAAASTSSSTSSSKEGFGTKLATKIAAARQAIMSTTVVDVIVGQAVISLAPVVEAAATALREALAAAAAESFGAGSRLSRIKSIRVQLTEARTAVASSTSSSGLAPPSHLDAVAAAMDAAASSPPSSSPLPSSGGVPSPLPWSIQESIAAASGVVEVPAEQFARSFRPDGIPWYLTAPPTEFSVPIMLHGQSIGTMTGTACFRAQNDTAVMARMAQAMVLKRRAPEDRKTDFTSSWSVKESAEKIMFLQTVRPLSLAPSFVVAAASTAAASTTAAAAAPPGEASPKLTSSQPSSSTRPPPSPLLHTAPEPLHDVMHKPLSEFIQAPKSTVAPPQASLTDAEIAEQTKSLTIAGGEKGALPSPPPPPPPSLPAGPPSSLATLPPPISNSSSSSGGSGGGAAAATSPPSEAAAGSQQKSALTSASTLPSVPRTQSQSRLLGDKSGKLATSSAGLSSRLLVPSATTAVTAKPAATDPNPTSPVSSSSVSSSSVSSSSTSTSTSTSATVNLTTAVVSGGSPPSSAPAPAATSTVISASTSSSNTTAPAAIDSATSISAASVTDNSTSAEATATHTTTPAAPLGPSDIKKKLAETAKKLGTFGAASSTTAATSTTTTTKK